MVNDFFNGLSSLMLLSNGRSRAINAENPYGEKGKGGMSPSDLGPSRKGSPCIRNMKEGTTVLAEMEGPGVIQHIWITVTDQIDKNIYILRDLVLRMYWDDEKTPSVECPLGDFFCNGFARSYQINSLPIVVNPTRGFNCYFPMPFKEKAKITIENQAGKEIPMFFYHIDYCLYENLPDETAYFHAQWRRKKITNIAEDYIILDHVKGRGHYVGTFLALAALERYCCYEGELKFYIDGDMEYPTICGTGTEDYFGGAWGFAIQKYGETMEINYSTPFMGYPYYSNHDDMLKSPYYNNDCVPMRGLYRWHIMDPIHFTKDIKITLQQIGSNDVGLFERQDDISTVAYWYQTEPHNAFIKLAGKEDRWPR